MKPLRNQVLSGHCFHKRKNAEWDCVGKCMDTGSDPAPIQSYTNWNRPLLSNFLLSYPVDIQLLLGKIGLSYLSVTPTLYWWINPQAS